MFYVNRIWMTRMVIIEFEFKLVIGIICYEIFEKDKLFIYGKNSRFLVKNVFYECDICSN